MSGFIQKNGKTIIGMVHCLPLPGTAGFAGDYKKIMEQAVMDAKTLEQAGVTGLIVENMGDTPFSDKLDTPQVVALAAVAQEVKKQVSIPIGIDAAFNDCVASLSIAGIVGADFVRIPVFVDTVVFTNGIIYPCARLCMETRRNLGLEHVQIIADVQVKHSHMLVPGIDIETSAKDAVSNGADGIIVTGISVGKETPIELIERVKNCVSVPVLAGSGVNANNINQQLNIADGCIIGSSLKEKGNLLNPISLELASEVINALK